MRKAYLLLWIAGLLDAETTILGLNLGYTETRLLFIPFLATAILAAAVYAVAKFPSPSALKFGVTGFLVSFAYSGAAWNVWGLLVR